MIDCVTSAVRTKYGEHYYDYNGKACEILDMAEECLASINGNCATDPFFSMGFSAIQQECDQEKRTPWKIEKKTSCFFERFKFFSHIWLVWNKKMIIK